MPHAARRPRSWLIFDVSQKAVSPAQEYAKSTVGFLKQDLQSFEAVLSNTNLRGKLGVAMITNAAAALDVFAWLLYQKFDLSVRNAELFKSLVSDDRFFAKGAFVNPKVLYGLVRCGVVHQFYPKGLGIVAFDSDGIFFQDSGGACVNAVGFYRTALSGLRKVRDYILTSTAETVEALDLKLEIRRRIDFEALEGASLDPAMLPPLPKKG